MLSQTIKPLFLSKALSLRSRFRALKLERNSGSLHCILQGRTRHGLPWHGSSAAPPARTRRESSPADRHICRPEYQPEIRAASSSLPPSFIHLIPCILYRLSTPFPCYCLEIGQQRYKTRIRGGRPGNFALARPPARPPAHKKASQAASGQPKKQKRTGTATGHDPDGPPVPSASRRRCTPVSALLATGPGPRREVESRQNSTKYHSYHEMAR
jgi:hypothetical protein